MRGKLVMLHTLTLNSATIVGLDGEVSHNEDYTHKTTYYICTIHARIAQTNCLQLHCMYNTLSHVNNRKCLLLASQACLLLHITYMQTHIHPRIHTNNT